MPTNPYKADTLPLKHLNWIEYITSLGQAHDNIAKFDGLLQGIPNPKVLLSPLTTQEAVLSSKIEGTQATLEEVLAYEADPSVSIKDNKNQKYNDIKEILNYRRAMVFAMKKLQEIPLSVSLLKNIHQILLTDVRSQTTKLGEFRDWQVYIGKDGTTIEEAKFIPPTAKDVPDLMSNLEKYIHYKEKDPIAQLAIVHAQFEIIHPFGDGNGRVGRMILPLFLFYKGILSTPMFYLSAYFERNREEYYSKLANITKNNDWDSWILFFLKAVKEQSEINIEKARDIKKLHDDKKTEIREITKSQYSTEILDYIFSYPFFNTVQFIDKTKINSHTSKDLLKKLVDSKILFVTKKGSGRNPSMYVFPQLLEITK